MRVIRLIVSWYFLAEAILCIGWALWSTWSLLYTRDTAGDYALVFTALALIGVFGLAAWALRREQSARKGWVIAASLLNILLSIGPPLLLYGWIKLHGLLVTPGVFWHMHRPIAFPLVLGIIGLLIIPRDRPEAKVAEATSF